MPLKTTICRDSAGSGDATAWRDQLPATRPLKLWSERAIAAAFEDALGAADAAAGAHCVHELWMRGAHAGAIDTGLERLWLATGGRVPDWLPTQSFAFLPALYEVAQGFSAAGRGRSHVYLVLLDYADRRGEPHGIYVGQSTWPAARRFEQHKAGIRAAGAVLKRGLEPLLGPVMHLVNIRSADALRIEADLAEALRDAGLRVEGGR